MARQFAHDAVHVVPVRAGYLTFAFAALGLLVAAALVGWGSSGAPTSVAAALGLDDAGPADLERRRALAVAERTAACMRSRGFRFDGVPDPAPTIPDAALDPVAWASRWGFGVSTSVGAPGTEAVPDVNAARAASLPASVRERYRAALHGEREQTGCIGAATTEVYGLRERSLAPLREALADLDTSIEADPAMEPVRTAWAACAATALEPLGVSPVPDRRHMPGKLLDEFAERVRAARSATDLATIQEVERRVAVVIAHCEAAFAEGRAAVATTHEAAFVRVHGDALRRIGAAIRAAEAHLPSLPSSSTDRGR